MLLPTLDFCLVFEEAFTSKEGKKVQSRAEPFLFFPHREEQPLSTTPLLVSSPVILGKEDLREGKEAQMAEKIMKLNNRSWRETEAQA